jgi:CheY-like chemotaxis protein
MPGMSGLEVAEKVRARRPWTPVVIITGYGTDIAEERAKAAGVSKFLHKPLSPAMIEDSARDVLAVPAAPVAAAVIAAAPEAPVAEVARAGSMLGNILLFFAAPFIGLAYIAAMPFYGLAVLAFLAGRATAKNETVKAAAIVLKHVAMVVAAPFVGLAYVVLFPFIGLALLLWMAGKAMAAKA